jgi:hypothetical protein
MENLHMELERVEPDNKGYLELISREMNAVTTTLCVYTEFYSNTWPPTDPNARGNSPKSAETVNVSVM